ncbi:MAG: hypothetical protein IE914_10410, partial [Thiotrichales bacterium]|nr:hypothetical protein [Thiotrichales bacterium]
MFFGNKEKKRLNKLKKLIEKSGLFDQNYYLLNNDDFRWSSTTTPLDHYLQTGMKEHRKPSKDFEPLWYLEAYPDVRANGMDALEHFVKYGQAEGRFMNAREKASYDALKNANVFDAAFYKNSYDDLKKQKEGFDYLLHYVRYGQAEGRRAVPSGTETVTYQDTDFSVERSVSEVFDTEFYLNSNPDVKGSGIDPLRHYASYGWKEGRRPNEWFDPSYYLNSYPDVAFSGQEPLQHFCKYGWKEDRNPSALFST